MYNVYIHTYIQTNLFGTRVMTGGDETSQRILKRAILEAIVSIRAHVHACMHARMYIVCINVYI
jgi:hypothetical protein